MSEREAVIWCPRCREDKCEVLRVQAGNEGVYQNVVNPPERAGQIRCEQCDSLLERKK